MSAELRKLLALPTPRWTLFVCVAGMTLAAIISVFAGPGPGEDMIPVQLGLGLTTGVAAIVLGAWIIGLEYGQKTMRRALTADPSRSRLVLNKLAVLLGAVTVVTVVLSLVTAPIFSAIASSHDESMPVQESLEYGLAQLFNNLVYAMVSFALALVTRSMAGGMALALAFAFVIDNALSAIPTVGDYSLSKAVLELMTQISGEDLGFGNDEPDVLRAIGVTAAWVATLIGLSFARFSRTDVE